MRARLGILVGLKGRGSNMAAIARACASGSLDASVEVVVAPSADSPALGNARALGLHTVVAPYGDRFAESLLGAFQSCDLICLAGFMRLVPSEVLSRWPKAVLNIHPALLPEFGGKGMYGSHVHEAVLQSGAAESGCSIHYVTERYDEGEVVFQLRCPVLPDDTPESLAARVLELEHKAYPRAIEIALSRLDPLLQLPKTPLREV